MDVQKFRKLAFDLGFGRQTHLCAGMTASAGVLPTVDELLIPAELGNFSFGQGKLTATPLQINQLTCAIASGGRLPMLRLIRGVTLDGRSVANEKSARRSEVMTSENAAELRSMMTKAVYSNPGSKAAPRYVRVGAKTSTAQTGRFDDEGNEL
ncbi:MAG: penicillin-binding protein 2, partial [Ruminococcus sp.]|nr:penicillin-binding protein 2 [Ruminococcus sp.]